MLILSKSERERQIPHDVIYMCNVKYGTSEPTYKIKTDSKTENRLEVAKREGGGSGMDWEFGLSRCKLLHLKWISNEILLYNTGRYI